MPNKVNKQFNAAEHRLKVSTGMRWALGKEQGFALCKLGSKPQVALFVCPWESENLTRSFRKTSQ